MTIGEISGASQPRILWFAFGTHVTRRYERAPAVHPSHVGAHIIPERVVVQSATVPLMV